MDFNFKTIFQFNDHFKDEKTCYEFLEKALWNGVPVCPHCGGIKYYKVKARGKFKDIPSYRCGHRECDLPFTVRSKSIFEGSKVELRKWLQAIYEISVSKKGISSIELASRIGVSQKTGWFINHRVRAMLKRTDETLLKDVVQLDETYVGGKNKNRHSDKKVANSRGFNEDKTMVFGARGLLGHVRTQVIQNAETETIRPIVEKWVEKGSIMVTDEARAYHPLGIDYFHISINHKEGQYASGAFSSNGLENFWSLFKRGIIGTWHSISPQHVQKYADEFSFRYNQKDKGSDVLFNVAIKNSQHKRVKYRELTGLKFEKPKL